MKITLCAIALALLATSASAQTMVGGYMKQNGTYVAPYIRTAPDSTIYNNRSYQPRQNLYGSSPRFNPPKIGGTYGSRSNGLKLNGRY